MDVKKTYISGQRNLPTRVLAKRQIDFVNRHQTGDILDVGCGDGIIAALYGDRVTSCDIADNNRFGIKVDQCKGESLPYGNDSFDTVCLIGVIEHTEDAKAVLSECRRVLRRGGRLIITYPLGYGWQILSKVLPRDGVKLHADFRMNGHMRDWWLVERQSLIPGFFVGEVYV